MLSQTEHVLASGRTFSTLMPSWCPLGEYRPTMQSPPENIPIVSFFRFFPRCRYPQRAERSAAGTLPTRAFRFCEPVCAASSFGWYMFPPMDFSLLWDGSEVMWAPAGAETWQPLQSESFPEFDEEFDRHAPPELQSCAPAFLGALTEPGLVQIWSGFAARTRPGWSLLLRPLPNLAHSRHYEVLEGIIETDQWFGPLFTNVRLTKTDVPIHFRSEFPMWQVQPLPRVAYADDLLNSFEVVPGMDQLEKDEWQAFRQAVAKPDVDPERRLGHYAVSARKRQKKEQADQ